MEHSKLPFDTYTIARNTYITESDGTTIAQTLYSGIERNTQNAAFIVTACNNHAALVGALSNALDAWYVRASNDERSGKNGWPTWVFNARIALAAARQTQGEAK